MSELLFGETPHLPDTDVLLILDLGMPEMDSCEVASRLKARPEFRSTRLLAFGVGQERSRESSAAGFEHHLVKPVDLDLLRELLSQPADERGCGVLAAGVT